MLVFDLKGSASIAREAIDLGTLRGLAWDHRRCWGPLDASIESYTAAHPGLAIQWDRRSLYEFGEGRIEAVLDSYDLIIFDHPFIGQIASGDLMVPFDTYLSAEQRAAFTADTTGESWQSYIRDGRQWALPIDAACQVASYRPDLLERYGEAPRTHAELTALAARLRQDGKAIGLPLVPTDAMCLVLTFCAQRTNNDRYGFVDGKVVEDAVAELAALAALAHPKSWDWNPIRCYDHMVANDDVVYVPYAFGYVNYASATEGRHLRFIDIPVKGHAGALLGGAGIGVSARSPHRDAAMAYAIHLSSPEYQRTAYVEAGGQPGSRAAWTDRHVNATTRNFFSDTLATIDASYLRPTDDGFIDFFRETAHHAAEAIRGAVTPREFATTFEAIYARQMDRTARAAE